MRKFLQLLLVCLALGLPLTAQTSYILTASPSNVQSVVNQHGLTVVKELYDGTNCVMLVTSASADVAGTETEVESDLRVVGFEPEQRASLPELTGIDATSPDSIQHQYSGQPAGTHTRNVLWQHGSQQLHHAGRNQHYSPGRGAQRDKADGQRLVAIIDTGADLNHPAFHPYWFLAMTLPAILRVLRTGRLGSGGCRPAAADPPPVFWMRRTPSIECLP